MNTFLPQSNRSPNNDHTKSKHYKFIGSIQYSYNRLATLSLLAWSDTCNSPLRTICFEYVLVSGLSDCVWIQGHYLTDSVFGHDMYWLCHCQLIYLVRYVFLIRTVQINEHQLYFKQWNFLILSRIHNWFHESQQAGMYVENFCTCK